MNSKREQFVQPNHESWLVHCADTPSLLSMGRKYGMLSNDEYNIIDNLRYKNLCSPAF